MCQRCADINCIKTRPGSCMDMEKSSVPNVTRRGNISKRLVKCLPILISDDLPGKKIKKTWFAASTSHRFIYGSKSTAVQLVSHKEPRKATLAEKIILNFFNLITCIYNLYRSFLKSVFSCHQFYPHCTDPLLYR